MIQASIPKPIEIKKAPERAEVVSNNKVQKNKSEVVSESKTQASKKKETRESSETNEFDKELKATIDGEEKVKTIQVTEDQKIKLPSELINPNGSIDSTSPKVFDPSVTKGVEDLIRPKTTEMVTPLTDAQVLELAQSTTPEAAQKIEGELSQLLLKTPQVAEEGKPLRAPAIDFAPTEIDPQLLNNEDFVAQKNLGAKKVSQNAYGMKVVPTQTQKIALESGLKQTQVVKDAGAVEGSSTNSQQFILGLMNDQKSNQSTENQVATKAFDMNHIKSSDSEKIINQIADYVIQAKAAKEPTVNMRVNHQELGMIDITVSKSGVGQETIAINIGTHSIDGKNFFQQNSKDLLSHLSSSGLTVTDMKVETPSQTAKNDFDFGSQSGKNQQGFDKQFGSEQNQRRHEQERRQDLWKLFNKEAA